MTKSEYLDAAFAMSDQMQHAADSARGLDGLPDRTRVENVVVLGVGTSGVAGDTFAAVASPFVPVPIQVVRGYEVPAYVGDGSLVFAVSYSGNAEETVEAATTAASQGAKIVVIASGGTLEELATSWAAPLVHVPTGIAACRNAIGALCAPMFIVLEEIGLFVGATQWVNEAILQLKSREQELVRESNAAAVLAKQLSGKFVVIQGGGAIGNAAAYRWKTQINEVAKTPAFSSAQPELFHNELVGWQSPLAKSVGVVSLRHDDEHPQVSQRFDRTQASIKEHVALVENVAAEGEGPLAQLFDLVLFGDVFAYWLAKENGVDASAPPILNY